MHPPFLHRAILLAAVLGLIPIALSYGLSPGRWAPELFGFSGDPVNLAHILRAVMGLYLGMIVLWLLGFFVPRFTAAALLSLVAFMLGLAFGRFVSFLLDGTPAPLLTAYFGLEIFSGLVGLWSYRKITTTG